MTSRLKSKQKEALHLKGYDEGLFYKALCFQRVLKAGRGQMDIMHSGMLTAI